MLKALKLALLSGLAATLLMASPALAQTSVAATLRADQPGPRIAPEVYGQFAEHLGRGIYEGIWVGEDSKIPNTRGYRNDVVAALKALHVPLVRWPGGCFADDYHWREGIGPRDKRPVKVNVTWGGVEETNAFGTHEFMDFAELIGAKTYVAGNVGNGSPQEMAEWVEYLTSPTNSTIANLRRTNGRKEPWKLDYFGIGNENWGCGGEMTAEHYTNLYRNFAAFVRVPAGTKTSKIAGGPGADDYKWTETLMAGAGRHMDALSLHYYVIPTGDWGKKGSATQFDEQAWADTMVQAQRMDELVTRHSAIMDKYDPEKRVGLYVDEWGIWHDVEPGTNGGFLYQQNTMRDAVVAAATLNIFHKHAERVRLTAIAQMVNVLQAMILTDGDKMILTPTYWVYDLYRPFQGATALPVEVSSPAYTLGKASVPAVTASAGRDAAGIIHLALVNLDPNKPATVTVKLSGVTGKAVEGRILTAPTMASHNTFAAPEVVKPTAFKGATLKGDTLTVVLPSRAVAVLDLR
ncbi:MULTISPECIES: alpha-N-arabinofuranosidase [unclassified Caulobacter]|uniref:alpha-N-arabinofuranosidase n=1 Tax=unclassified Caulobacter TaxID=2648921 RepID=UPI000D3BE2BD|nr:MULTISPECIES: alpha-N-arabinofuranosidase [unclassified Caulobacter]PTS87905.1 alpha-N-arabinofuranosidase [Caulobacter sp. HMWF009]PTT06597.1 alpha-N-arabinofuranosidase [Caulobacter sp. HMWF025]PTT79144.1 alpha-N-arabinofuranosidase [Pseudomonas sp. HMWF010]